MHRPLPLKRLACMHCLRPQSACICRWVRPLDHATEVLFLQHPLEVGNAKGSARLLHLSLARSRLVVGETFDERQLHALLYEPFDEDGKESGGNIEGRQKNAIVIRPVLLYPDTTEEPKGATPRGEPLPETARTRLVVLDGTWRKSSRMLHGNPLLQRLPRFALRNPPPSHYAIRKARRPDQLSTYEATCLALAELEGDAEKFAPLLDAFDGFVAQQQAYIPTRSK